jgi:hypothetical protein
MPSPVSALTGDGILEHLRGLEAVDLVERDHDGSARGRELLGDEAVATARGLARVEHQEHGIDIAEAVVDRALHATRERVEGPLESRQVDQHDLVAIAVHDPERPLAGCLRLVGHDRDVRARERVRERRLADVWASREADEAAAHDQLRSSKAAGSSAERGSATTSPSRR